ncbi:MAG: rod shape-determining protein MreC [Lentisphaeraceae bacterium]|nr:rod shape-determining protein MreC [Lentisphaeraceae bacterium]
MRRLIRTTWISILVLSCFLLVLPYLSPRYRGLLNNFFHPIIPDLSERFYSDSELQKENAQLRSKLNELDAQQGYWNNLFNENRRLRQQLKLKKSSRYETVVAEVSVRSPLNMRTNFIIAKGKDFGLAVGMPVLVGDSLIGRIAEVSSTYSMVKTFITPDVRLFCKVKGTESYGRLNGEAELGENLFCRLTWLPRESVIKPGMFVTSAGLSDDEKSPGAGTGLVPGGLKVGVISSVSKNVKFQEAVVKLSAAWRDFKYVSVLKKLD